MVEIDDTKYVIRDASHKDLQGVLAWLRYEYEKINNCTSGFWCNRNLIEEGFASGTLVTMVDRASDEPRAFCLGGLVDGGGIFAVHHDWQRRGLGTVLFRYCLEQAKQANVAGLHIQCSPETSIPFWRKCGFRILDATPGGSIYGVLPIEREFDLPMDCVTSTVGIELFNPDHEEVVAEEATIPAAEVTDGEWQLARRFVAYVATSDVYIRVSRDNRCLSHEKIKRSGGVGVKYCRPFVTLDRVHRGGS